MALLSVGFVADLVAPVERVVVEVFASNALHDVIRRVGPKGGSEVGSVGLQ